MAAVGWEFQDGKRVLTASLECSGEPRIAVRKAGLVPSVGSHSLASKLAPSGSVLHH